ncbi:hypothetical protein DI09_186p50 [Mitosporidium daphniae]|uniref:Uncharacterized protein n=1 Tax=Mitosporidium daphniae TaxID=1485682 RepID=A0A098VTT0_9MICR|nr:uncharacterized protein DI09_186p50 [Mitosporidium daphniae]KGG52345.1 hypothetical protein DI09_186p50 [Mitosporidium daphniae]|eukprot:XP_013238781.1 uncharacterized protein DI09_186p50 [Mitosporidium daphniae]
MPTEDLPLPTPPSVVIETIPPAPFSHTTTSLIHRRYIRYSTVEYHTNPSSNTSFETDIDSLTLMEQILLLGLHDKEVFGVFKIYFRVICLFSMTPFHMFYEVAF